MFEPVLDPAQEGLYTDTCAESPRDVSPGDVTLIEAKVHCYEWESPNGNDWDVQIRQGETDCGIVVFSEDQWYDSGYAPSLEEALACARMLLASGENDLMLRRSERVSVFPRH